MLFLKKIKRDPILFKSKYKLSDRLLAVSIPFSKALVLESRIYQIRNPYNYCCETIFQEFLFNFLFEIYIFFQFLFNAQIKLPQHGKKDVRISEVGLLLLDQIF